MTIEELQEKHCEIIGESDLNIPEYLCDVMSYTDVEEDVAKRAAQLSIQFAIEVLESFSTIDIDGVPESESGSIQTSYGGIITNKNSGEYLYAEDLQNKIQELKKYLDGNN